MKTAIDQAIEDARARLYRDRYCSRCEQDQPIIIFRKDKSETIKKEGNRVVYTFIGSVVCSVCKCTIEKEHQ